MSLNGEPVAAADIDRIEALRGPGSSLYGDTSIGGVIQIFTANRGTWLQASSGTFRSVRLDAGSAGHFGDVSAALSGSFFRTRGFRRHSAGHLEAARGALDAQDRATAGVSMGILSTRCVTISARCPRQSWSLIALGRIRRLGLTATELDERAWPRPIATWDLWLWNGNCLRERAAVKSAAHNLPRATCPTALCKRCGVGRWAGPPTPK